MNPEHKNQSAQVINEHQHDREFIEENRTLFWLVSTVACEQSETGAIVVDMKEPPTEMRYPFRYLTKGEIEYKDKHLESLLREYDPHREFVIVLSKSNDDFKVYLGKAPQMGWWDSMSTR